MQYGHFDAQAREYVITDPHTPVKWINYIGTRAFGGFVDHTGGALICRDDPALNRITKYVQQMPASDFKGETTYLRIHRLKGYQTLSPWFVPGLTELERFECRIGLGYTRLVAECAGLRADMTVFVPRGARVELRSLTLTNIGDAPLIVDAIPLVGIHPSGRAAAVHQRRLDPADHAGARRPGRRIHRFAGISFYVARYALQLPDLQPAGFLL